MREAWFIGRKLINSIHTPKGELILSKEIDINQYHINILQRHGIKLSKKSVSLFTRSFVNELVNEVSIIYQMLNSALKPEFLEIQEVLLLIIESLSDDFPFDLLQELYEKDSYTYRHCVGVGVISYFIGKWLSIPDDKLYELAVAGLLHDLGKLQISDDILKKTSSLSNDEYNQMKSHTIIGYEMIKKISIITEEQALAVLQHHERINGSGYPYRLKSDEITRFSKIIAIADVFHTMISERVYKKPVPLYEVFTELYRNAHILFDEEIVYCFIAKMMEKFIGCNVVLTDGQVAKIILIHNDDLLHPLVAVKGKYYDLRSVKQKITSIVGY